MSSDNSDAPPPRHQDIVINVGGGGMVTKRDDQLVQPPQHIITTSAASTTAHQAMVAGSAVRTLITPRHSRANIFAKLLAGGTIILAFGSGFFNSQYMSFGAGVMGTLGLVLQEYVASTAMLGGTKR